MVRFGIRSPLASLACTSSPLDFFFFFFSFVFTSAIDAICLVLAPRLIWICVQGLSWYLFVTRHDASSGDRVNAVISGRLGDAILVLLLRFGGSIHFGRDAYTITITLLFSIPSAAGRTGIALLSSYPVLRLCCVRSTSRCYSSKGSSIALSVTRCFVGLILLTRVTLKNPIMAELRDSCTHGGFSAGESTSRRNSP